MSKFSGAIASKTFTVNLVNEAKGIDTNFNVTKDDYILDIAEENGLQLPYSCRAGACFDCLAKVIDGKVMQTEKANKFIKPDELNAGYILLCAASPCSHCTIVTHQAEELFTDK